MNTTTTAAAEITDPSTPVFIQCYRCGGAGRILAFSTIHAGLCYACNGSGGHRSTVGHEAKLAKRREQAAVRRQAKRANERAEIAKSAAAFLAGNSDLAYALSEEGREAHHILTDLSARLNRWGTLSPAQIALAVKISTEARAPKAPEAAPVPVPTGRVEVTGTIVSTKMKPAYAYHGSDTPKMVVHDDSGFRVFGTIPSALATDLFNAFYAEHPGGMDAWSDHGPEVWLSGAKGRRVTFTATLEQSDREVGFGFFSRPTKARVLTPSND